jgi:2-octaprenylphenol hydroxylase
MVASHDILIVGGGMVGAALACALAKQTTLSIAVLEAQSTFAAWSPLHYHHRVSAISPATQHFFHSLGVKETIQQKRVSPYTHMEVWDAKTKGRIHFNSSDIASPVLGHVIENVLIQDALIAKMKEYAQIDYISSLHLTDFHQEHDQVTLHTAEGRIFSAPLAIAADGARSWLRTKANITVWQHDYAEEAIVTTVQTEQAHEKTAFQVFLESGPLAFLPLADKTSSSIVWSLPTADAKQIKALDESAFKEALGNAFSHRLGAILKVDARHAFPLQLQKAMHYVKPSIALVGDAAHTIHPLVGQGVNMGFADAAHLAAIITHSLKSHRPFWRYAYLRRYERWCKAEHLMMFKSVDMIKSLFANQHKAIQTARAIGLNAINQSALIKNQLIRYALGQRI